MGRRHSASSNAKVQMISDHKESVDSRQQSVGSRQEAGGRRQSLIVNQRQTASSFQPPSSLKFNGLRLDYGKWYPEVGILPAT